MDALKELLQVFGPMTPEEEAVYSAAYNKWFEYNLDPPDDTLDETGDSRAATRGKPHGYDRTN